MKNNQINLHADPKKKFTVMLFFTLISLLINLFLIISVNDSCTQIYSLLQSGYVYSAITKNPIFENDYFQYNAGIDFALSSDAKTSLNADIVMQSNETTYTDLLYWNTNTLSTYGIAISNNLAKSYGLHLGDKLYSKHIVNGVFCEYSIERIIPEMMNVRIVKDKSYNNGIIIMGYDEQYVENITHSSIVFTKDSIEELSAKCLCTPENIIYREDELIAALKNIISYLMAFGAASIAITFFIVLSLAKNVSHNFKRLIMLGYEKKRLNNSYYKHICSIGLLSVTSVLALSSFVFFFIEISTVKILLLILIPSIELITLFITATITNKRLWRK